MPAYKISRSISEKCILKNTENSFYIVRPICDCNLFCKKEWRTKWYTISSCSTLDSSKAQTWRPEDTPLLLNQELCSGSPVLFLRAQLINTYTHCLPQGWAHPGKKTKHSIFKRVFLLPDEFHVSRCERSILTQRFGMAVKDRVGLRSSPGRGTMLGQLCPVLHLAARLSPFPSTSPTAAHSVTETPIEGFVIHLNTAPKNLPVPSHIISQIWLSGLHPAGRSSFLPQ